MGMFENLASQKIVENAERLTRIMEGINNSLHTIAETENHNFNLINENFKELDKRLKGLEEKVQNGR